MNIRNAILIFVLMLFVSCTKNTYKVNCTFSHFNIPDKKFYKSDPVDLFVLANDTTELRAAIKETLSNEYNLYSIDSILIYKIDIVQIKEESVTNGAIYFGIPEDEKYKYLNLFKKTYVLNGALTKTFTNYSPELIERQNRERVLVTIKNNLIKLTNSYGELLLAFNVNSFEKAENFKNRLYSTKVSNSDENLVFCPFSTKWYYSHKVLNHKDGYEGTSISFTGENRNFKNIVISISFESGYQSEVQISQVDISYHKKNTIYNWWCHLD